MIRSVSRSNLVIKALAISFALIAGQAHALQILEGGDGATLYGKVSKKEQTRITIEQGRVSSLRVREGTLNIDPDDETGQLFVTVPEGIDKPINGFLTTDSGLTYTLILQPTDVPSDSIVIKQPKAKSKSRASNDFKTGNYEKAVKRLVTVMANDELPDDMEIKEVGQAIFLWKEASMTLERQYMNDSIVGERYLVANISKDAMVLDEREFYRKGVHVVAIDQINVASGASTRVYVIRERGANE